MPFSLAPSTSPVFALIVGCWVALGACGTREERRADPAPSTTSTATSTTPSTTSTTSSTPTSTAPSRFGPPRPGLALVYTASVQGYVEPCGCTGDPLGGIARYAALVDDARRTFQGGVVVVDGGDLLFEKPTDNAAVDVCQAQARTELLVSTYARIGVEATVVGPLDDVRGAPFRTALYEKHGLTALAPGQHKVIPRGDVDVVVFAVGADDSDGSAPVAAPHVAPGARAQVVVALAQMDRKAALAKDWSGVDVVVVGRAAEAPVAPVRGKDGRSVIVSAGWQSQHAGIVELQLDGRGAGAPLALDDRAAVSAERATLLDVRIAELDRLLAQLPDGPKREFQAQRRATFAAERDALAAPQAPLAGPHVVVTAVPLARGLREDPQAQAGLAHYERSIPDLVLRCERDATCADVDDGAAVFVGDAVCASCHSAAKAVFDAALVEVERTNKDGTKGKAQIGHAKSWQTLTDAGRDKDRSCVGCHSVGFMAPGGPCTTTQIPARGLAGVQCESCHGAGSLHAGSGDKALIRRVVDEAVCRSCHVPPHIPSVESFVFSERVQHILGPGHGRPL